MIVIDFGGKKTLLYRLFLLNNYLSDQNTMAGKAIKQRFSYSSLGMQLVPEIYVFSLHSF